MLTYLWSKENAGSTKYYGIDGSVYNNTPTIEEIMVLQHYACQLVNNSESYKALFNAHIASILGLPADDSSYKAYYEGDQSCAINICNVTASIEDNGGPADVQSYAVKTDNGCYNLHFTFYNIGGSGGSTGGVVYRNIMYASDDAGTDMSSDRNAGGIRKDWIGLYVSTNYQGIDDASKYIWFHDDGSSGSDTGVTSYIAYVFTRWYQQPVTPTGGTYETPRPNTPVGLGYTWELSIGGNARYTVWMSSRRFYSDNRETSWSEPKRMADSKTFQTEWAMSENNPSADTFFERYIASGGQINLPSLNGYITGSDESEGFVNEEQWRQDVLNVYHYGKWSDVSTGAKYMAWCNCIEGHWQDWTVSRILGETGEPGPVGARTWMVFATLDEGVVPATPSGGTYDVEENTLSDVVPTYWSPDNQSSNDIETRKYTWLSTGTFGNDGHLIGHWSPPIQITGEDGIDGTDGENREYIYKLFDDRDEFANYKNTDEYGPAVWVEGVTSPTCLRWCYDKAPNYQTNDFIPDGWADHPEGISLEHRIEACCVRVKVDGEWGQFTDPFIWAAWGEDGIDGDGVEYIFCVTTDAEKHVIYTRYKGTKEYDWVEMEHLPEHPTEEDTEESPHYVKVTTGDDAGKYVKDFSYTFPVNGPEPPCITDSAGTYSVPCWLYYRDVAQNPLSTVEKQVLGNYYQKPDFVPGDKIWRDIQDKNSVLWDVAKATDPDFVNMNVNQQKAYLTNIVGRWDLNWTDNPLDVGPQQPYEWVSIRKYKAGTHDTEKIWEAFSEPALWNNWAKDGVSVYTSMVFARTNDDISGMNLCGGTFEYPMPGATSALENGAVVTSCEGTNCIVTFDAGTSQSTVRYPVFFPGEGEEGDPDESSAKTYVFEDTVPISEDLTTCIWMSMCIFGDQETGENQGWTSPQRMSDTADFNVEWCLNELNPNQISELKSDDWNFGRFVKYVEEHPEEFDGPDDELHTKAEALFEGLALSGITLDGRVIEGGLGSWSDEGDSAVYMATTTCRNGRWSNWTVSKIKGEKGDAGEGLKLLGSTVCVVSGVTELDSLTGLTVGDYVAAICVDNTSPIVCNDTTHSLYEFFRYEGDDEHNNPIFTTLSCEMSWRYASSTREKYDSAADERKIVIQDLEDDPNDEAADLHLEIPVDPSTDFGYYLKYGDNYIRLYYGNVLNVSDTIIINGIEPDADPDGNQKHSGEELELACDGSGRWGLKNGDFISWDGDSWEKRANLSGTASYIHVKFADAVTFNGQYYRLSLPDDTHPTHGEATADYMGTYVDSKKADREGKRGNDVGPYDNPDEHPVSPNDRYWCEADKPYRWNRVVGNDGIGHEYIYFRSRTNVEANSDANGQNRPLVPMFGEDPNRPGKSFYDSEEYQSNDWYPGKVTPINQLPWINGTKALGWTDNAIECNTEFRYRWVCQREKVNGKWLPFVGDKDTSDSTFVNGKYASFDANCTDDLIIADFDNDNLPVHLGDTSYVYETTSYTLIPSLTQGTREFTITAVTSTDLPQGISMSLNTAMTGGVVCVTSCTVTINSGTTFPDNTYTMGLSILVSGFEVGTGTNVYLPKSATAKVTIMGIKGDTIYHLVPSMTSIKRDPVTNLLDNSSRYLKCDILKKNIGHDTQTIPFTAFNHAGVYPEGSTSHEFEVKYWYDDQSVTGLRPFASTSDDGLYLVNLVPDVMNFLVLEVYDKNGLLNDRETIFVNRDGTSFVKADLDNESDSVPLDNDGKVWSSSNNDQIISTTIHLYSGRTEVKIYSINARLAGDTNEGSAVTTSYTNIYPGTYNDNLQIKVDSPNADQNSLDVHFKIKKGWLMPDNVSVELLVCEEPEPGQNVQWHIATMSITGIRGGKDAQILNLMPDAKSIVRNVNTYVTSPTAITCSIQQRSGDTTTVYSGSNLATFCSNNDLTIWYTRDSATSNYIQYTGNNFTTGVSVNAITSNIKFYLYSAYTQSTGGKLVDSERVPLLKDGKNGDDGNGIIASCQYYVLTNTDDASVVLGNQITNGFIINPYTPTTSCTINGVQNCRVYMNGTYYNGSVVISSAETAPTPTATMPYLWRRTQTWYSRMTPSISTGSPELMNDSSNAIDKIENFYISGYTSAYTTSLLGEWQDIYDMSLVSSTSQVLSVVTSATQSRPAFTTADTYDLHEGETVWAMTIIEYMTGKCSVGALSECRSEMAVPDVGFLKDVFDEAVEQVPGAYLREFLGVTNGTGDHAPVVAFMNGMSNAPTQEKPNPFYNQTSATTLMLAAGVTGGLSNQMHNAKFRVYSNGNVYAENGYFKGSVSADTGYFHGTVQATDGEFTGTIHATDGEFEGIVSSSTITGSEISMGSNDNHVLISEDGTIDIQNENFKFNNNGISFTSGGTQVLSVNTDRYPSLQAFLESMSGDSVNFRYSTFPCPETRFMQTIAFYADKTNLPITSHNPYYFEITKRYNVTVKINGFSLHAIPSAGTKHINWAQIIVDLVKSGDTTSYNLIDKKYHFLPDDRHGQYDIFDKTLYKGTFSLSPGKYYLRLTKFEMYGTTTEQTDVSVFCNVGIDNATPARPVDYIEVSGAASSSGLEIFANGIALKNDVNNYFVILAPYSGGPGQMIFSFKSGGVGMTYNLDGSTWKWTEKPW